MSPIEGVSDIVRMPRLGKIRLGVRVKSARTGREHPRATEYFVVPPEVAEVFGEQPTRLDIMFPTEDPSQWAQQWYRAYSLTQGLVCIGDGATSRRKVDVETGDVAGRETKDWEWIEGLTCNPEDCPLYGKQCRRVMNLQFFLPKVVGLGVWQIDTSSFYGIVNINSMVKLVKAVCGRISFIPLTLCMGPLEVTPPGGTKKTVYVMHLEQDIRLAQLQALGQREPTRILLPPPDEEVPLELYPGLAEAEGEPGPSERAGEAPVASAPPSNMAEDEAETEGPVEGEEALDQAGITSASVGARESSEEPSTPPRLLEVWDEIKSRLKSQGKGAEAEAAKWLAKEGELEVGANVFQKPRPPAAIPTALIYRLARELQQHQPTLG